VHRSHRCIGMVCPGTLFIGDNGAFLCAPVKVGVKFEHWRPLLYEEDLLCVRAPQPS
jgi:hypothetical protein